MPTSSMVISSIILIILGLTTFLRTTDNKYEINLAAFESDNKIITEWKQFKQNFSKIYLNMD